MMKNVMNDQLNRKQKPWYQEPFVWLLIALPLSAVLAGFYTLYLAIVSNDGLVVDDYYKQGLTINKRLEKQDNAIDFGLVADMQMNYETKTVRLLLDANDSFVSPENLTVVLSHATRQGFDQTLLLTKSGFNSYQGSFQPLISGHWIVVTEGHDWRLIESLYH